MTPEKKSESIVNLPPKIKKAIAGGIVAASLVTGCNVAVEALPHEKPIITSTSVPTKDPETNADPTQVTYELTPTQKATDTMINPPTLTPEPTATVTEVIENGEIGIERKQEIVDRVNAFINAEGQYSDEELRKDPTWFDLDTDENKPLPLGMLDPIHFQGVLVDYEIFNNNCHLFMGTLLRTGERAVFNYSFPDNLFVGYSWKMSGLPKFTSGDNYTEFKNLEEQNLFFDSVLGKPLTFTFLIDLGSDVININENFALLGSKVCQDYLTDLYNLVPIVEDYNVNRPSDNEQSALYFTKDNLIGLNSFDRIKNNVLCGNSAFTIRKP